MGLITVESGVCLGFGGTNARVATCENGDVTNFTSVQTPDKPREFFGWMARQVLGAAHKGHRWVVAGFPGPVTPDGKLVGPLTNVNGMAEKQYDLVEELAAVDLAAGRLLRDEGFRLVNVNDGNLAAHAAASRVGNHKYNKTGALIIGTGLGAGVVEKDPKHDNVHHADEKNPYEIGHLILSSNPLDRFEDAYSGTGISARHGDPRKLPEDHPIWKDEGAVVGRLATTLGLMNGVELVVPTGGVGAGASAKYGPHLAAFLEAYKKFGNGPQKLFVPEVAFVDHREVQEFEMYGAEGVMRDVLTRAA